MRRFRPISIMIFVLASGFSFGQAHAQLRLQPGIRAGYYADNSDFFLGADVQTGFRLVNANANAEYVFVSNGTLATFNLDGTVDFSLLPALPTYIGAGLGLLYADPENSDSTTDGVFNLVLGAGFRVLLSPYVQVKYILADSDQLVIGAGIRF